VVVVVVVVLVVVKKPVYERSYCLYEQKGNRRVQKLLLSL